MLYAIDPADMSIWATLRCPQMLSIYLLLLFPYYGVSLWMMLLLLVCIDWRCDYQLINYIVLIRALSFITVGLSWTCQAVTHTCTHTQRTCSSHVHVHVHVHVRMAIIPPTGIHQV